MDRTTSVTLDERTGSEADWPARPPDYLGIVESAYRLDLSDQDWLSALLIKLRPAMDRGLGVLGWFAPRPILHGGPIESPIFLGCPEWVQKGLYDHAATCSRQQWLQLSTADPCASWKESVSKGIYKRSPILPSIGVLDIAHLRALDSTFTGCVFTAPARGAAGVHPRQESALSRVGAHIVTAYRLRRRLLSGSEDAASVDAILDPRGRVVHAEGSAKGRRAIDALIEASRATEHSRQSLRHEDPERAVELWRALVAGRWSLVDRTDRDGRRFLLARRNPPGTLDALALAPRELHVAALLAVGHSQKLLSYELGLSEASISELARSALRKLGMRSRAELIRLFSKAAAPKPD